MIDVTTVRAEQLSVQICHVFRAGPGGLEAVNWACCGTCSRPSKTQHSKPRTDARTESSALLSAC